MHDGGVDDASLREALRRSPPPELIDALRALVASGEVDLHADGWLDLVAAVRGLDPDVLRSTLRRQHLDELFGGLTSFIGFVGYSRSGASVIAALLDAHPNLVVAHELDVFQKAPDRSVTDRLALGTRDEILQRVLLHSAISAEVGRQGQRVRPDGSRYYSSYAVEGGWQGRYDRLVAIGTKNAIESAFVADRFGPAPFRALEEAVELPMRFVHVVRDPFDNIATMRRIHGERSTVRYVRRAEGVRTLKESGFDVLDVHLDDVLDDPRAALRRIAGFYGVPVDDDIADACAAMVADRPSRTAQEVSWTKAERHAVEQVVDRYPWLARYRV